MAKMTSRPLSSDLTNMEISSRVTLVPHTYFDQPSLGLFASSRPEIASVLEEYLESYQTTRARSLFSVAYIREEFKQPPSNSNYQQRQDFLKVACFHGNADLIQQLDIAALTQSDLEGTLICAAQSSDQALFDVLMNFRRPYKTSNSLPYTILMRDKLTNDPVFLGKFIRFIEECHEESLSEMLCSSANLISLLLPTSHPLPIRKLIEGQIRRYETQPLATEGVIPSLVYKFMVEFWRNGPPSRHLLQGPHFYDILRRLAQSPAFELSLNTSSFEFSAFLVYIHERLVIIPYPSVQGYSALMLALHCGMKPAVQILVDAGAFISKPMSCGKSALSLARENIRARHPRQRTISRNPTNGATISTRAFTDYTFYERDSDDRSRISESTDQEMLEILLKALRDRGEVERNVSEDLPVPSRWETVRTEAGHFARWFFKPSYTFNPDSFRENGIYAILVSVLWLLSVLKVFKFELGDCPSHFAKFLSRPIVMFALIAWILSRFL
ncbi:hypothetical protein F5Y03DRAFT_284432 [Xylaria venustula]|nr:hypothetical protein F5Y03DRAFT_284432 [Xylaria venustula]